MMTPATAPPTRSTPANAVVVPTAAAVAAAAVPAAAPAAPAAPAALAPAAAAPAAAPSAACAATIAGEPVRIRASVRPSNLFIGSPFRSMVWYGIPSVLNSILKMDTRKPSQCQGMSDPIRSGSRRPSLGKRILRLRYATLRMNGGLRYAHRMNGGLRYAHRTNGGLRYAQDERGNHSGNGAIVQGFSSPIRRPPPDGRLTSGDCEHPSRGSPVVKNHRKRYKPGGRWRTVRRGFHRP